MYLIYQIYLQAQPLQMKLGLWQHCKVSTSQTVEPANGQDSENVPSIFKPHNIDLYDSSYYQPSTLSEHFGLIHYN